MKNVNEWKEYRHEVRSMGARAQTSRKSACIPKGCSIRKRKALSGIMLMSMLAVGALVAMFYVIGGFPQTAEAQGAMGAGAVPAGAQNQGVSLGTMADYLFVLALPFAVGLLINQCMILKQISSRVRK